MFREVIVVEGREDTRRLREVFGAVDTIETNGSAIDATVLEHIARLQEQRGVIVLTDPDFPGTKIRQAIVDAVPTVSHAFIDVAEATPHGKGSLGVEHASDEALKRALQQAHVAVAPPTAAMEHELAAVVRATGLVGQAHSAQLRERVCALLRIGHTNGKQLVKRLRLFGISPQQLQQAVTNARKEEANG